MPIDSEHYLREMAQLVREAVSKWQERAGRPPVYAVSIWTDPAVATSAVSIETRRNSDEHVRQKNDYSRAQRELCLHDGDLEMAALFDRIAVRNCNTADFEFPMFVMVKHNSFDIKWGRTSRCWRRLEPLLLRVRDAAIPAFAEVIAEEDAELSVNTSHEWYDHVVPLRGIRQA